MTAPLCPYCFKELTGRDTTFRCVNHVAGKCAPELDRQLAEYEGTQPVPRERVFTVPGTLLGRSPMRAPCVCGYSSWKRVCPHCHNELPSEFGPLKQLSLGLIGAKEVGKSNYIGVLINRIANEVCSNFGGAINSLDDQTGKRYKSDFERYIFTEGEVVPATASSRTALKNRYPLNYRFQTGRRGIFSRPKAVSLSLFDTAGEDLDSEDIAITHVRYIENAAGLIFLLDPLQLKNIRAALPANVPKPKIQNDPGDIIDRATRMLRRKYHLSPGQKIPIPVAVVFSKIDVVRSLVEKDSPLHRASVHPGLYDDLDGQAVHESIRSYMRPWGAEAIDNTLRTQFANYRYFGVSSFGYSPHDNQLSKGVAPFRVEDPFLWLLAQFGYIGKVKPVRTP